MLYVECMRGPKATRMGMHPPGAPAGQEKQLNLRGTTVRRVRQLAGTALTAIAGLTASAAWAGPNVGVSVEISQPGVYGRVDIGRFPQPQVVVAQPVIIAPQRARPEPVYMWVPPGHRKKWSRYCGRYHACGVPVYFVRDQWYHDHVGGPRNDRGERYEGGYRDDNRPGRGQDRGRDGRDGRGEGRGHGHGHGH